MGTQLCTLSFHLSLSSKFGLFHRRTQTLKQNRVRLSAQCVTGNVRSGGDRHWNFVWASQCRQNQLPAHKYYPSSLSTVQLHYGRGQCLWLFSVLCSLTLFGGLAFAAVQQQHCHVSTAAAVWKPLLFNHRRQHYQQQQQAHTVANGSLEHLACVCLGFSLATTPAPTMSATRTAGRAASTLPSCSNVSNCVGSAAERWLSAAAAAASDFSGELARRNSNVTSVCEEQRKKRKGKRKGAND